MKQGFLRSVLHDLMTAILAGLLSAVGLSLLFLLVGLLVNSFHFRTALVVVRGGLLVVGALELFLCAGLLIRNRSSEKICGSKQWKKHFNRFGLFPVVMVMAITTLTTASLVDYYLYF